MTFLENVDKAQLRKILLIVISALTLIALALLLVIIVLSIEPKLPENVEIEFKNETIEEKDLTTGALILADADHPFTPGDDLKSNVINCQQYRNENRGNAETGPYYAMNKVQLTTEAMGAAHTLLVAAEEAVKEDNLLIKYAFFGDDGATAEYSTGMLMLLTDYDENKLPDNYAAWLDAHAYEYGFIESFDDAYRYVGIAHAKYMTDEKLSLVSYINLLKSSTTAEKPLMVSGADSAQYAVYYVACANGDTIKVPANAAYEISGTNEGGVIVTVKTAK